MILLNFSSILLLLSSCFFDFTFIVDFVFGIMMGELDLVLCPDEHKYLDLSLLFLSSSSMMSLLSLLS